MDLNDIINQVNQQYEEVDSKTEKVEEKVDTEEMLKMNEVTEKWLDEEREYKENSKDDNYSRSAFTRKGVSKESDKDDKKSEKKSNYSSYYSSSKDDEKKSSYSQYGSYNSSSSSSKKSSDEKFYDKVEEMFNNKINRIIDDVIDKNLNRVEDGQWDILDLQYELNKKRVSERYYEDKPDTKEFEKLVTKCSDKASMKLDIAEVLLILKINPHRYTK